MTFSPNAAQPLSITTGGGEYAPYAKWELKCSDGALMSGGVPFSEYVHVTSGASCTLKMTASNNGWKRNHWKGFGRSFTMVDKGEVM